MSVLSNKGALMRMDYQARCRGRSNGCHGSFVFWAAFSKCLCEVSLFFSRCRLRKLFHSSGGVLNSLRESGWKLGFTAEVYELHPAQPQLLAALSSAAFQLRSSTSACQMSRWNKGAAWVITPLPTATHLSQTRNPWGVWNVTAGDNKSRHICPVHLTPGGRVREGCSSRMPAVQCKHTFCAHSHASNCVADISASFCRDVTCLWRSNSERHCSCYQPRLSRFCLMFGAFFFFF